MSLNLNHLAIFRAVAETGSVSRGAERLMVSQPAVSKQLRLLETSLKTQLFERLPKGVRLTDAGRVLADHARRLFAIQAEAERAMGELLGLRRGRLIIGASTTIGVYLLPAIFVQFRQQYPGIEARLEIVNSRTIQQRLLDGQIDIGLTEGAVDPDAFDVETFAHDELVAITSPAHALARKRSVAAVQLCREPFVVHEGFGGGASFVERALVNRDLTVRPILSLNNTEAIKRAVAAGLGVAIVSKLAVQIEVRAGLLKIVKVRDLSIRRPLYRVRRKEYAESKACAAFLTMLRDTIRSRSAT